MKYLSLLCLFFISVSVSGQNTYKYEVSSAHPFGLPHPDAPKELLDYAPLIGACNCSSVRRNPDQSWADPEDMLWRFKYIMNGTAVQDESLKASGGHSGSIRQFIKDSSAWYVHYYSNVGPTPVLSAWKGGKRGDSIVLYRNQTAPNGMEGFYRITFSNMTKKGFNWIGEWVNTTETITYPTWKITCRKRETE